MIAIIGGGSWATAIAKILLEEPQRTLRWWVRTPEVRDSLIASGRNPKHLTSIPFDPRRLAVSCNLQATVEAADTVVLAVPSVYVADVLRSLPSDALAGKRVVSAVKGYVPQMGVSVTQFLHRELHVADERLCVVSGPSHAEEVAEGLLTFLTAASTNRELADEVADMFRCSYIHTSASDEVQALEFSGLAKNVYAVAVGMAAGMGYGDNLTSVLTAAAARELHSLMPGSSLTYRLMADLMATCFSRHSRNRALGEAVVSGIAPDELFRRTGMVAEGYYSSAAIHALPLPCPAPVADAVYRVLHQGADARQALQELIDNIF